jgi:hypothetical protein
LSVGFRTPLSRDALEVAAEQIQEVLDAHTVRLVDGATASANFAEGDSRSM